MAVRRRGKKWIADYYDAFRIRRWKTFGTKDDARNYEAAQRVGGREDGTLAPTIDPDIMLTSYAERWLKDSQARGNKFSTITRCESALRTHILPHLGALKLRNITRPIVRQYLLRKLVEDGASRQGLRSSRVNITRSPKRLARGTVKHHFMTLSGILSAAVEDGIIKANPVRGLWKTLGKRKAGTAEEVLVLAFDVEEAGRFLRASQKVTPEHHPQFATMMFAGLRPGELLALMPGKIDIPKLRIRVDRQMTGTPKDDEARTVDIATPLATILSPLVKRRGVSTKVVTIAGAPLASEAPTPGPWLFYPELGPTPVGKDVHRVRKDLARAFARVLKFAGLPLHHTPKSLRHTFGSQLIARGVSPAYVQQQMGHSSIKVTVDTYGSWLPVQAPGAVDALANAVLRDDSSRVVADGDSGAQIGT